VIVGSPDAEAPKPDGAMKAAITGARGFVGRHLTAHLRAGGDEVSALDVDGVEPVDITDLAALSARVRATRPDVLYHLAARTHVGESWTTEELVRRVNVDGTANVLEACAAADVGRVVFIGSAEEYGRIDDPAVPVPETAPLRPISPYGRSKADAEELALRAHREGAVDVICIRAFNHAGPGQAPTFLVPGLAARIAGAERSGTDHIAVGNLGPVRDYTDVRDIVRAYRLLVTLGEPGTVYNVCSGHGVSVADIAHGLLALAERPLRLEVDPELVRESDVQVLVGDATRLRAATGWAPEIPLDRTLADVLAAARAAPNS
jgi:GDP-4-dehydro-6-deoxy-D-mannose reductase